MRYSNTNGVVVQLESIEKSKQSKSVLVYVCRIIESYCEEQIGKTFRQNEDIFKKEWSEVK